MRRGELYWADLKPRSGCEQAGRRPVLVVSHDGFNQAPRWNSLIVVPLTTAVQHRSATTVFLQSGTANLTRDCLVLGHQITTLDRSKFTQRIAALPQHLLQQVERAILRAVAITHRA